MEIKRILSLGLLVCILMASCGNTDEPENPNGDLANIEFRSPQNGFEPLDGFEANTRYDNPYRDFARAMTALNLDEEIVKEIHDAVSRSIACGLDEVYFFNEALDNNSKVFAEPTDFGRLLKRKLEAFPKNAAVKYINEFWENYADKDRFQIYWPYSENWDGKTMPLIAAKSAVYSVSESGLFVAKSILTDEYAKNNPVIVINDSPLNYSELPDFSVTNYVKQDRITTIYYPTYKYGEIIEGTPNYLTNNDIDSYFEKESTATYSLYMNKAIVPSMVMSEDVSEGGVYITFCVANIDGQRFTNQSELDACEVNYWFNRICVRRQFCRFDSKGDFVSLNMLLTGDAHPHIASLPVKIYKETGLKILWSDDVQGNLMAWASDGSMIEKSCKLPYIDNQEIGVSTLSRPGLYGSHYETDDLFGDSGVWNLLWGYGKLGCAEGGVTPDWMK